MKLITAVIKPFKLEDVPSGSRRGRRSGYDCDRGERIRAPEGSHRTLSWRRVFCGFCAQDEKLKVAVSDEVMEQTIEAIVGAAGTGSIGDGKVFVSDLDQAVRIRTGETGDQAL